jgi:LysR family glycine cleavage system transcriptional activator
MTAPLPPLASVRAFEAAARLLSFTEAAQALGMTQAAVSYQIKLLEERLGVPLFQRLGRGVVLTAQGQALAPIIIRAFDQMRAGFASLHADTAAILTISCTNSFAHLWLAPRIGQFQMLQPDLAVRIHISDHVIDLAQESVDIAVRGGDGSWPGVDAELLTRNRVAPMCSPDFLAKIGPVRDATDLIDAQQLSPHDFWWDRWFAAMGIVHEPRTGIPLLVLDSQVLEGRAAMAGQGFAILIPSLWRREIEAGLLVEPVPSCVVNTMDYWVVYPHANRNQPKVKAFRDWIRTEVSLEIAADPEHKFFPKAEASPA